MPKRRLPIRPDLDHLKHEAKALLASVRKGEPAALEDFQTYLPGIDPQQARLSEAQVVLARSYRFPSWARLSIASMLCRAIEDADLSRVEQIVREHPHILSEGARGLDTLATFGAPLTYAVGRGQTEVADLLARLSGDDLQLALDKAAQHGLNQLRQWFVDDQGRPKPGAVMNPCETLNADGLKHLLDHGAELADERGNSRAPVAMILETYSRNPAGKHRCLDLCCQNGITLPDTPAMALHRGRIDLLERALATDPALLDRRLSHADIYPPALGCGDEASGNGLHGTPINETTLLHLCGEFGEVEIAAWLLEKGADPNAAAEIDAVGFGGHTPLFNTVVTLALAQRERITMLLLDAGADPHARANLSKRLMFAKDESVHEYANVTPREWGEQFHGRNLVNKDALRALADWARVG